MNLLHLAVCTLLSLTFLASPAAATEFTGSVVDHETGTALPCRVYLQAADGTWLFVKSTSPDGSALPYREQWVPMAESVEKHTTVSAHPFRAELRPGRYTVTIERGKEFFPLTQMLEVGDDPVRRTFRLKRWINLAERGWYSGETHVHRRIAELPNAMLAEDLNVAFPVTFWTINANEKPGLTPSPLRRQWPSPFGPRKDHGPGVIHVDPTHVFFPRNTEYEIFSVNGKRHVLGAVFVLNHRTVFQRGMPPVAAIAEQAHREGALLDLDKHSWPWAMMLVPIAKIDLFELSNNSVWRTKFGFRRTSVPIAPYMEVESDADGAMTEWGWLNFGFENYYSLLNCGFRLQPTAGTASGVHPVPLGYSRVYVHVDGPFKPDAWLNGLRRGRSFVTTGPMLFATVDGALPGEVFQQKPGRHDYTLKFESISDGPIERVQVLVNGEVVNSYQPRNEPVSGQPVRFQGELKIVLDSSSWIAVRSVQRMPNGRRRFAHEGVLPEEALAEFKQALSIYEGLRERAVNRPKRKHP